MADSEEPYSEKDGSLQGGGQKAAIARESYAPPAFMVLSKKALFFLQQGSSVNKQVKELCKMQKKGRTKPDAFDIWADGRAWSEKIEERTARRYANMYTVTGTSSEDAVYHPTPTFLSDGGDDGGGGDGDGSGASSMTDTFVFPGEALQLQLDAAAQDLAFGSGGGDETVTFLADVRGCVGEDAFGRLSSMLADGHGACTCSPVEKAQRGWSRTSTGTFFTSSSRRRRPCCARSSACWPAGSALPPPTRSAGAFTRS